MSVIVCNQYMYSLYWIVCCNIRWLHNNHYEKKNNFITISLFILKYSMLGHNSYQLSKTNRCFFFSFFVLCIFLSIHLDCHMYCFETNKKTNKNKHQNWSTTLNKNHITMFSVHKKLSIFFFSYFQISVDFEWYFICYLFYFILHLIATFSIHTNTVHQINLSNQIKWSIRLLEKLVKKKNMFKFVWTE